MNNLEKLSSSDKKQEVYYIHVCLSVCPCASPSSTRGVMVVLQYMGVRVTSGRGVMVVLQYMGVRVSSTRGVMVVLQLQYMGAPVLVV